MKKNLFLLFFITSLFFFVDRNEVIAQPPPPPPPDPDCWPPPCIPIDGGIIFLIAAGVALGGKKLYNSQKSTKQ